MDVCKVRSFDCLEILLYALMHLYICAHAYVNTTTIQDASMQNTLTCLQIVLRQHVVWLLRAEALACLRVTCVTLLDLVRAYMYAHACLHVYACLFRSHSNNFGVQVHSTTRWQKFFSQVWCYKTRCTSGCLFLL